ncbi:SDR family NAD(P)-dependent oxidoreductase [Salinicoccus sp. Marseille-QA3877]
MESSFQGKTVLITGAAGGIGKAVAELFYKQGTNLALVDLDLEVLKNNFNHLTNNENLLLLKADVSKEIQVKNYVDATISKYGNIDIFFNNAGIEGNYGMITDTSTGMFDSVFDVNVKGVFYGLKYVLKAMIKNKSGNIINSSSIAGLNGSPGLASYSASKHAVIGLTKTAALEASANGIRVNAICPSPVNTRMINSIDTMKNPENASISKQIYEKRIPMQRYSEPSEIAESVLFLASNKSSFITGSCLRIDGGMAALS